MKTLPVCVGVQKAHSWAGLGESERLRRGQGDCKTEFPERFEEGTNGRQRPLLSPGPCWCLRGHMDACLCVPSHQPILHPPPPPLLRDRTVHVNESWPEWRGQLQLRGICLFFCFVFLFLAISFLFSLFPPSQTTFNHLYCSSSVLSILSLPFWGISDTVWKPGNRQLPPILYSNPLPSLRPYGLFFWQDTGCQLWL